MNTLRKALRCACGDNRFNVRVRRDEQVGLVTCKEGGHPSLLLDSRDYWHDVIQASKPRESRCRCGGRLFEIELKYIFRDESHSVRAVDVELRCIACGHEQIGATFEIDYDPTEPLLSTPLDPCPKPWLKARQTELSALWLPQDVDDLVAFLGGQHGVRSFFAGWRERPKLLTASESSAALASARVFDLFFSVRGIEFPEHLRDCWKRLPLIHLPTPIQMNYRTGNATLYFLRWADEFLVDGSVVPQETALLELAGKLEAWLCSRFVSDRGKRTFDNRSEYERLKGGW